MRGSSLILLFSSLSLSSSDSVACHLLKQSEHSISSRYTIQFRFSRTRTRAQGTHTSTLAVRSQLHCSCIESLLTTGYEPNKLKLLIECRLLLQPEDQPLAAVDQLRLLLVKQPTPSQLLLPLQEPTLNSTLLYHQSVRTRRSSKRQLRLLLPLNSRSSLQLLLPL